MPDSSMRTLLQAQVSGKAKGWAGGRGPLRAALSGSCCALAGLPGEGERCFRKKQEKGETREIREIREIRDIGKIGK